MVARTAVTMGEHDVGKSDARPVVPSGVGRNVSRLPLVVMRGLLLLLPAEGPK